jgi:hypothetical protein
MNRRILAGILWFFCGWYVGALAAWALTLNPILAPILAVAAALLCAGDPRRIIWTRPSPTVGAGIAPESA